MKPTQNISTNWYVTKDTRFKEGLSGMSPKRHLLPDRCLCQAPSSTDWTRHGWHSLMKVILLFTALVAPLAAAATFDGGIQGRVLNAQGGPVAGATVTVTTKDEKPRA